MNRLKIKGSKTLTASSVVLVLLLMMTVSIGVPVTQDPDPKGGLQGGKLVDATDKLLVGKWTDFHVWEGDKWKHAGEFTISESKTGRGLEVTFTKNGGGDNPKAMNAVEVSGSGVILNRDLSPYVDSDGGASSQTWTGKLLEDKDGHLVIEGSIIGAGMPWETRHKHSTTFRAVKVE